MSLGKLRARLSRDTGDRHPVSMVANTSETTPKDVCIGCCSVGRHGHDSLACISPLTAREGRRLERERESLPTNKSASMRSLRNVNNGPGSECRQQATSTNIATAMATGAGTSTIARRCLSEWTLRAATAVGRNCAEFDVATVRD